MVLAPAAPSLNAQRKNTPLFHCICAINFNSIAVKFGFVKGYPLFSGTDPLGHANRAGGSPYPGGRFFQHRLTGAHELPQAVRPFRAAGFSLNLSEGIRRLRTAGTLRRPPRGQKGRDTYGFPSSLNSYLSLAS